MGKTRSDMTTYTCDICNAETAEQETQAVFNLPAGWYFATNTVQTTTNTGIYIGPLCWKKLSGPSLPLPAGTAEEPHQEKKHHKLW